MIQVQHVDFIAQPVSDLKRAAEFYGETIGLMRNPASGDRWAEYETGNLSIALSMYGGTIGLRVEDVDAARATLEGEGLEFGMDTFDSGVCNGAPFTDPDGNRLLLHRRYAPLDSWELETGDVQRTDFIGVSVTDRARGGEFYGGRLGLARNGLSSDEWPEFGGDNVGLVLSTPRAAARAGAHPAVLDRVSGARRVCVHGAAPSRGRRGRAGAAVRFRRLPHGVLPRPRR